MNKFLYFLGFFIAVALQLRAMEFGSMSMEAKHDVIGAEQFGAHMSEAIGDHLENHVESFIDMVSTKIADKLGDHLDKEQFANHMMVMLEGNAELFDVHHQKGQNLSMIQDMFFSKLKHKFANSKFGKKVKSLGVAAKKKLTSLYHAHKGKIAHFFKTMIRGFVIPKLVVLLRRYIPIWKKATLEAVRKMRGNTKQVAQPVVEKLYDQIQERVDEIAAQSNGNVSESEVIKKIAKDEKDIRDLEEKEASIINHH